MLPKKIIRKKSTQFYEKICSIQNKLTVIPFNYEKLDLLPFSFFLF